MDRSLFSLGGERGDTKNKVLVEETIMWGSKGKLKRKEFLDRHCKAVFLSYSAKSFSSDKNMGEILLEGFLKRGDCLGSGKESNSRRARRQWFLPEE